MNKVICNVLLVWAMVIMHISNMMQNHTGSQCSDLKAALNNIGIFMLSVNTCVFIIVTERPQETSWTFITRESHCPAWWDEDKSRLGLCPEEWRWNSIYKLTLLDIWRGSVRGLASFWHDAENHGLNHGCWYPFRNSIVNRMSANQMNSLFSLINALVNILLQHYIMFSVIYWNIKNILNLMHSW